MDQHVDAAALLWFALRARGAVVRDVEAVAAGGGGQNFRDPAVMDDAALAALHSRYRGAVAHVDVDEDGRAVKVVVDGGGLDPDARADLERQLAALRYVPAECNGLRCAASFELRV